MMKERTVNSQKGVMLLEALVAILIFTLGIIAVMGMQAASISQVTQAKFRTDASYLANQIVGKMWTDIPNLANYATSGYSGRANWNAAVAATLPTGNGIIAVTGSVATVTVQWKLPNESVTHQYVTIANINVD
jgi:type IV pilus assembly protein PilV